jgi:deoxyribodipyrimidine photo-lyase
MSYSCVLFIFRRDLRTIDNTGLIEASKSGKEVIPLFIFTPQQVSHENKYRSANAIQFMVESLVDLHDSTNRRLWVIYADEIKALEQLHRRKKFDAIFVNEDYTPYSIKRDKRIENWCKKKKIDFFSHTDSLLLDTQDIAAGNGNRYSVFTHFYKKMAKTKIRRPSSVRIKNWTSKPPKEWSLPYQVRFLERKKFLEKNDIIHVHGGRNEAKKLLKKLPKNYAKTRDFPTISTTNLSAHNHFGTVSIREVYSVFKSKSKELVQQLFWRDFYYYISTWFPTKLYRYQHLNKSLTEKVSWPNSKKNLRKWQQGMTGFPLADAGMRQLLTTGFMHNRVRMLSAMVLCKLLHVDWKYGEQYFTRHLVDIDRCQNIGNWNWSSSFGLDNASFLRIFNPAEQIKRFDPKCEYIKKWLPELKNVPSIDIINWDKKHTDYEHNYTAPIVDYSTARKEFANFYYRYLK